MDNRKTITTAARLALWEAHGRKCAYTGEPVAWSELEIDHIIPVKSDAARKTELALRRSRSSQSGRLLFTATMGFPLSSAN